MAVLSGYTIDLFERVCVYIYINDTSTLTLEMNFELTLI